MDFELTTEALPIPTHFDVWRSLARQNFGFDMAVSPDCQGYLRGTEIDGAIVHLGRSQNFFGLLRGKAETEFGEGRLLFFVNHHGGVQMRQRNQELSLRREQLVVFDMERPIETLFDGSMSTTGIVIDKQRLANRMRQVDNVHLLDLAGGNVSIFIAALQALEAEAARGALVNGAAVLESLLDLLALSVGAHSGVRDRWEAGSGAQAKASVILDYIDRHLKDPNLCPSMLAAHFKVSVRYLHKIFAECDRSVSEQIIDRRLESCRRDLLDQRQGHRSVSEIAFDHGFNDLSHFGRRFRQAYGVSPRQLRAGS